MRKLVFYDVTEDDKAYFQREFKNVFGIKPVFVRESLEPGTVGIAADAAVISVFVTSKVTAEMIEAMPELEHIACRSTGFNNVDLAAAKRHHVLVSTVPQYGENTVAEYAFLLLLALSRKLTPSLAAAKAGEINFHELDGFDLAGKVIGIVGTGRIGAHAIRIARGFGMDVLGYDPYPNKDLDVEYVEFEQLLEYSDVISLHAPATKDNYHLFNKETISKAKKGVVIINTARGELIETECLIEALYSGHVAAAGLDVLEGEDLLRFDEEIALLHSEASIQELRLKAEHNILFKMPNVIVTPHNAFNSIEALNRLRDTTVENIKDHLKHEPQNIVK